MNRLLVVAGLLVGGVGIACAQHGGGHGGAAGGFRGAAPGHGIGSVPHGGFSVPGRGAYVPRYAPIARGVGRESGNATGASRERGPGKRPVFYARGRRGPRRGPEGGVPYFYGGALGYGWIDTDYPGYADDGYSPDDQQGGFAEDPGQQAGNYFEQPEPAYSGPMPEEPASVDGGTGQQESAPARQIAAPELYDSNAVTLVFKDGRPNETIHNYALTRTMLFVTDGRHRQIPVADLDMAATEKANLAAGVEFQLPH